MASTAFTAYFTTGRGSPNGSVQNAIAAFTSNGAAARASTW